MKLIHLFVQWLAKLLAHWPWQPDPELPINIKLSKADINQLCQGNPQWSTCLEPFIQEDGSAILPNTGSTSANISYLSPETHRIYPDILPHGWVYQLLVSTRTSYQPDGTAFCVYKASVPWLLCLGHFFKRAIVPGVILAETIGHAFAVMMIYHPWRENGTKVSGLDVFQTSNYIKNYSFAYPRETLCGFTVFQPTKGTAEPTGLGFICRIHIDGTTQLLATSQVAGILGFTSSYDGKRVICRIKKPRVQQPILPENEPVAA